MYLNVIPYMQIIKSDLRSLLNLQKILIFLPNLQFGYFDFLKANLWSILTFHIPNNQSYTKINVHLPVAGIGQQLLPSALPLLADPGFEPTTADS